MPFLIPLSLVINTAIALMVSSEQPTLALILGGLIGVGVIGCGLILAGHRRWGAYAVMVSTVPMVPIGLIGAFGARQVIDGLNKERFQLGSLAR